MVMADMVKKKTAEQLWSELLQPHLDKLPRREKKLLMSSSLDQGTIAAQLQLMSDRSSQSKVPRCLKRLQPSIDHLEIFARAISTIVHVQPTPVAIIWSCIGMLLNCAHGFMSTFEQISEMLEQMSQDLAYLNRYIQLLQQDTILDHCIKLVVNDYIGFCITAFLFYNNCSWYTPVKFLWSAIDERFQETRGRIRARVQTLESEVRVRIDEITVQGIDDLRARLPQQSTSAEAIFNVDFSRNSFFTGRVDEIDYLENHYARCRNEGRRGVCTVHSMAGVGKTQLALEYAYRQQDKFTFVFWLPAEHQPKLAQRFAEISTGVAVAPLITPPMDLAYAIKSAKTWLQSSGKPSTCCVQNHDSKNLTFLGADWLLIYDNVESWDTIKNFWPSGNCGSILITTQHSDLVQVSGGIEIALAPFNSSDGASLLLKSLRRNGNISNDDLSEARRISDTLGGLPVAISHMAGYIDKSHSSLLEFSNIYASRDQSRVIWSRDLRTWTYQYHNTLKKTWDIALNELPSDARDFIHVLAMLDPDAISETLLFQNLHPNEPLTELLLSVYSKTGKTIILANINRPKELLIVLGERQLVRHSFVGERAFWSIHRALQLSILHRLDDDGLALRKAFSTALQLVRHAFPKHSDIQAPSNQNWEANEASIAHLLHLEKVYNSCSRSLGPSLGFAALLNDLGNHMWERGLYNQGIKSLKLAETIYKASGSSELIKHSQTITLLGGIYLELGISGRKDGLDYTLKCLTMRENFARTCSVSGEEMTEDDSVLLANSWNDVACCMLEYGCYSKVEIYLHKSLRIKLQRQIPENGKAVFNFAENYKNLGIVKTAQAKHKEAIELSKRAAEMIEHAMGPMSATTQSFRFHLAYALYQANNLHEALEEHEEVRRRRTTIFGLHAVHTLNSYYACSVVLQKLGQLEKAEQMLLHCLSVRDESDYPPEYFARVTLRLSLIYRLQNQPCNEIETLQEDAHKIRQKYIPLFSHYQLIEGEESVEMVESDHLIPIEGGRSTVGQLYVNVQDLPNSEKVLMLDI